MWLQNSCTLITKFMYADYKVKICNQRNFGLWAIFPYLLFCGSPLSVSIFPCLVDSDFRFGYELGKVQDGGENRLRLATEFDLGSAEQPSREPVPLRLGSVKKCGRGKGKRGDVCR